VTVQCTGN